MEEEFGGHVDFEAGMRTLPLPVIMYTSKYTQIPRVVDSVQQQYICIQYGSFTYHILETVVYRTSSYGYTWYAGIQHTHLPTPMSVGIRGYFV